MYPHSSLLTSSVLLKGFVTYHFEGGFSIAVFQMFGHESLILHTFSLQSTRAVNGSNDITDVTITEYITMV